MNRRIAKKVLRRDNQIIVDWEVLTYSRFQLDAALLRWHRDQRNPVRRYGRWDPRWSVTRREHERRGYVFPQTQARKD